MRRVVATITAVLILANALAAAPQQAQLKLITIANTAYNPFDVMIAQGTTVRWTNTDGFDHTVTGDDGLWGSVAITPTATFAHTFTQVGTFAYHCLLHASMAGSITVVTPSPTPTQTATATVTKTPANRASYLPIVDVPPPTPTATPTVPPSATPTFTPLPTVTPTSEPAGVFVLGNHTAYTSSSGSLHIIGEVRNNTTQPISFVKISADVFNGAQLVATDFTYADIDPLRPGDHTCFEVLILNPPAYTAYAFEAPTYRESTAALPLLSVLGENHNLDSAGDYHILGQVRNDTGATVTFVQPVAALYNSAGQVVDCDFTYVNSTNLAPGQVSAFDLQFTGRESYADVVNYHLQVDGHVQ